MTSSLGLNDRRERLSQSPSAFKTSTILRDLSSSTLSNVNNFNLQYQEYERQERTNQRPTKNLNDDDLPRIEEHIEIITDKFDKNFGQTKLSKTSKSTAQLLKQLRETYHLTPDEYYQRFFDNQGKNMTETFYDREAFYNSSSYSASFMSTVQSRASNTSFSATGGSMGSASHSPMKQSMISSSTSSLSPLKSSSLVASSSTPLSPFSASSSSGALNEDFSSDIFDKAPDQPIYFQKVRPFEENKRKLRKSLNTLKSLTKYNNVSYIKKRKEKVEEKPEGNLMKEDLEKTGEVKDAEDVSTQDILKTPTKDSTNSESLSPVHSPALDSSAVYSPSRTYYVTDPIPSSLSPVPGSKKKALSSSLSPISSKNPSNSVTGKDSEEETVPLSTEEKTQRAKESFEELGMNFNEEKYLRYQKFFNHSTSSHSSFSTPVSSSSYSIQNPLGKETFFTSPYKITPSNDKSVNMNIPDKISSRPTTPGYILLNNTASLGSSLSSSNPSRPHSPSRPSTSSTRPSSSSSGFQTFHLPQSSLKVSLDGVPILNSQYSTDIDKLNELNIAKNYGEDSFLNLFPNSEVPIVAMSQKTIPFSHLENIMKKATRNGLNGKIVDDVGGWGGIGTLIDEETDARRRKKLWNQKLREKKPKNFDSSLLDHTNNSFLLNSNFDFEDPPAITDNSFEFDPILEDDNESVPTLYHSENGDSEVWSNPSYSQSHCLSPVLSPRQYLSPLTLQNKLFSPNLSTCVSPITNSPKPSSVRSKLQNEISNSSNLLSQENILVSTIKESEFENKENPSKNDNFSLSESQPQPQPHNEMVEGSKGDSNLPKLDIFRNLNEEFESLKVKEDKDEFDFEDEDEDEIPSQNDEKHSFFEYEKDFNLFPTPSTVKSNTARPYKSTNIFEETYQFNTDHLKEVLQSPTVPPSSTSLFKSDVIHPVLIETSKEGLVLKLHSELPKNRPFSARDKIESNEFSLKDFDNKDFLQTNQSEDFKNRSITSPSRTSNTNFFSSTTLSLTELNPLTSTSYSTISSDVLLNCDEKLRKYQTLKNITPEEQETQFNILMQFYRLTNGKKWKKKMNWGNKNVSLNSWYGVSINPQGHIVSIELKDNNLIGPFPDLLASFYYLETLFLDSNQLEGELPDYLINQCPNLKSLSVTNNKLYGIIPFNLINKQNKLKELWLGHNQFYGIIQDGIGDLKSLTHLDLSSNKLEDIIPLTFGKLHHLIYLNLSNNKLTGVIPSSVASLSNLNYLYLNNNNLSGKVPFWILKKKKSQHNDGENDFSLSNLNKIEIFDNPLLEIDDDYEI